MAFLLVYGQRVAWRAVETGHWGVGSLIHYTIQLVSDYAAEFIINQGGWVKEISLFFVELFLII